jgi:cobalt-zinc-cadmium efflux system outer membrane protein
MTLFQISHLWLLAVLAGCAAAPPTLVKLPAVSATDGPEEVAAPENVVLTAFEVPEFVEPAAEQSAGFLFEETPAEGLTLAALEQLALANNPVVGQAAARVRALRGKCLQVGLKPNPTVGYLAGEIGDDGAAGQQGGFVGQQFISAGKLEKNRAVVRAEIERAEQELVAAEQRVRTDIRLSYYRALVAQQRVELATTLVEATGEAVSASEDLLAAEEIPRAALLQTQVEQQNALISLRTAQNELTAAWQQMSAVAGDGDLPPQPLVGNPTLLPNDLDWQESLSRLTTTSPEIAAAMAELSRSRRALNRACVQAVPDVNTQMSVQYDDATNDTIAGVQVGVPLPLWDRHQGGIRQAQAEITVASQNIDRVALDLKRRLVIAFQEYSNAKTQVETYAVEILPRAEQTFDLVRRGYAAGEVGYLELLTAQRTYAQTNLTYLDALDSLWRSWTRIDGMLLDESLATPL